MVASPLSSSKLVNLQNRQKASVENIQKTRKRADNRTHAQRRESALLASIKKRTLWGDINEHLLLTDQVSSELAAKHGKSVRWIRDQLFQATRIHLKCRAISKYNAWVHCKSLEVKEDLPPDEKLRLSQLQDLAQTVKEWREIPPDKMDDMIACTAEHRLSKLKGTRSTVEGHLTDVHATFKRLQVELSNLKDRCNISPLLVLVRTDEGHRNQPLFLTDDLGEAYVETFSTRTMHEFVSRYEAFALFHLHGVAKGENERKTFLKARVGALIRKGLREITGVKKAEMAWARYEQDIVQKYKVHLIGWPEDIAFNIHQSLGSTALKTVLDAITSDPPTCAWVKLTNEEIEERKRMLTPVVTKPRKQRSDKGKKRGKHTRRASSPTSSSEDDGGDGGEKRFPAPISREIIDNSDGESE